jgi:hypothetical protein
MGKLTLSVRDDVVRRAKAYATARSTSVSRLVEGFLDAVSRAGSASIAEEPPVLRRLRGTLKGARIEAWREHLAEKHR